MVPAARGRGLGAASLDAALDWCREQGCLEAEVVTTSSSAAAGYYADHGFRDVGRRIFQIQLTPQRS